MQSHNNEIALGAPVVIGGLVDGVLVGRSEFGPEPRFCVQYACNGDVVHGWFDRADLREDGL